MGGSPRVEDLIDQIYVKMELLESRINLVFRGDERAVMSIIDVINQVYDLLVELRRVARGRCV